MLLTLSNYHRTHRESLSTYFLTAPANIALDIIEVLFHSIRMLTEAPDFTNNTENRRMTGPEAIVDLNGRFRENGIGFQFEGEILIRLDTDLLHEHAVRPALGVLRDLRFTGANAEFLKAHEHYRHGRYEECLVECCKAFESTMKCICTTRKWPFKSTGAAKDLIAVCLAQGLLEGYLTEQMTALRCLFESGIPTARNKSGGHGQGVTQRQVHEHFARYVMNQTATTILFLVESNVAQTNLK